MQSMFLFFQNYANVARQGAFFLLFLLVLAIVAYGVYYLIGLFPPALQKPLYAVAIILALIFILLFLAGGIGGMGFR